MFNLTKMNFYRLLHSVSTWIILACTIALALFAVSMTNIDLQYIAKQQSENGFSDGVKEDSEGESSNEPSAAAVTQSSDRENSETDQSTEMHIGIYADTNPQWVSGEIDAGDMMATQIKTGLLLILCSIFSPIFVYGEQKCGFIKNIAGQFPRRWLMTLSQLVTIAFQTFVMLLVFSASVVLFSYCYFGGRLCLESLPVFLRLFAVQYLLHFGFSALVAFLCVLTKSSAFSMVIGILLCCGISGSLYTLITNAVLDRYPSSGFQAANYVLEGNITSIGIQASSQQLLRAIAVSLLFILFSAAFSMLLTQKRDIK